MIKERKEREERQTKILNTMKAVQKSSRTHVLNEQLKLIEKESILSKKRPLAETSRF
jgi:ATP-dependent Lon protease